MQLATAIVVARGGSTRLPNKALLPFAGTTLVGHKVRTLLRCRNVGRVVVGSDSTAILAEAERHGAATVERDAFHCDETRCSANEMIRDMVSKVPGGDDDVYLWAHPTNPLVRPETYDGALHHYQKRHEHFDSLLSATVEQRHAWVGLDPLNHNPWRGPHRTAGDLSPVYFQDGAIFIQTRARFIETSYFYGVQPLIHPVDRVEGWDIDTESDYRTVLALWSLQCEPPSSPAGLHSTYSGTPLALTSLSA